MVLRYSFAAAVFMAFAAGTYAQVCTDGVCTVEAEGGKLLSGEIFNVVCPAGRASVEPIVQAPRLESLEGKTIALVGGSFMASVTHPELKRLILEEYPSAKVYVLGEIGSAGVFPGPGIRRRSVEEFQARLKELGVDAVVSGNGGCGLCTPKEAGAAIAAEYIGIPSVTIAGPGFADQVAVTAANNGVAVARVAVYPGAFASHSTDELLENTRNVLWPRIREALTVPVADSERRSPEIHANANPGSRIDPSAFPFRMYEKRIARTEGAELTPCPQWYAAPDGCQGTEIMTVPVMKPGMTATIITGDSARNKVQIMPGGGYSTVRIELPLDWDVLMQEAGYEPLETFRVR